MWMRHGQRDTLRVHARSTRYPSNRDAVSITSVTTRGVRRDVAQEYRCAARVYSCTALEPALAVRSNGQRTGEMRIVLVALMASLATMISFMVFRVGFGNLVSKVVSLSSLETPKIALALIDMFKD
ncbi:hypothetical protein NDU88_002911 [Pleurodeles waltl]|uniref:Uncharacterized protein n=1 Tax=Pleurodeles waltl TaxID=8319 RepID=A0AAV7TN74_PLEWA|nr:hypothetical protein NDU88_002911 [Pleurodeles waltl]